MREAPLAAAVRETLAAGSSLTDLTVSNPTLCGFDYHEQALLGALGNPAAMVYQPDPRGLRSAREAVAAYYGRTSVDPGSILLTTSTSEAYSFLFRLLCNPGDELLVAQPGYPLFDFLSDLNDVKIVTYPLFYDFGWWIDFSELERRISSRTRAILVVHPNNPTGHATSDAERGKLEDLCVRHGLALIVDEVFLDYSLGPCLKSFAEGPHPCLTFVVSGLSKIAAVPQMKVGWLAGFGPEPLEKEALRRLEVISDTFLSLSAPAQLALPAWLGGRTQIQSQIMERVRNNLSELRNLQGADVLPMEAGWCAVIRTTRNFGEILVERLVREAGVLVHPGSFYRLPGSRFIVLSLLVPQLKFGLGVEKLIGWMNLSR